MARTVTDPSKRRSTSTSSTKTNKQTSNKSIVPIKYNKLKSKSKSKPKSKSIPKSNLRPKSKSESKFSFKPRDNSVLNTFIKHGRKTDIGDLPQGSLRSIFQVLHQGPILKKMLFSFKEVRDIYSQKGHKGAELTEKIRDYLVDNLPNHFQNKTKSTMSAEWI